MASHRARHPDRLERGHPFRQWKTWQIPGTSLTLTGYSRSNDKTFFTIPELACAIDAGLYEGFSVDTVLLTHTHHDHSYDIEFLATEADGRKIYAPAASIEYLERYIVSKGELNFHSPYNRSLARSYVLEGVRDGDRFELGRGGRYVVRVVECAHKIPCVGFAFYERKTRLSERFAALKSELDASGRSAEFGAIAAKARANGEVVQERYDEPRFVMLGDTSVVVYERNPWLFEFPVIVTECTFLDERERARAEKVGHIYWGSLAPIVRAHPKTTFVLMHFSLRHSDREVVEFFSSDENYCENVVVWAHPESVMPEQHQSAK